MFVFLWYTHAMKSSRRRFRETSLGGPRCGKHPSRLHYQAKKPSERKCPWGLSNCARCPTSMLLLQLHTKQTNPLSCTTARTNASLQCVLRYSNASCSIPIYSISPIDQHCIFKSRCKQRMLYSVVVIDGERCRLCRLAFLKLGLCRE